MRSDFDPKEKELAKFLEDWLLMQQKLYGSQHMWGVKGDAKADGGRANPYTYKPRMEHFR